MKLELIAPDYQLTLADNRATLGGFAVFQLSLSRSMFVECSWWLSEHVFRKFHYEGYSKFRRIRIKYLSSEFA